MHNGLHNRFNVINKLITVLTLNPGKEVMTRSSHDEELQNSTVSNYIFNDLHHSKNL